MKKLALLPFAALAFGAACSDTTAITAPENAAFSNGVSAPGTPVTATFVIDLDGTRTYRQDGSVGNNGKGTCVSGGEGRWYNPKNKTTSDKPHPLCSTASAGQTITVSFSEIANYVLSTNGNKQLNFSVDPELGTSRGIQYKANTDRTQGFGVLTHTGDSVDRERVWTINLGQADLNTSGDVLVRANPGTALEVCNADLGCHPGFMTW